ncbi:hypothetical protein RF11_06047 [Thelohanellus kitauei]|uniref:Uncharacterized protein n=1 Tax=Thelohanellus kitauei TaxID=669202 RepID=A0A0C2J214_THEKT|nr:hypothetical protein RF11_06047 [Thelohanellus kitauei]
MITRTEEFFKNLKSYSTVGEKRKIDKVEDCPSKLNNIFNVEFPKSQDKYFQGIDQLTRSLEHTEQEIRNMEISRDGHWLEYLNHLKYLRDEKFKSLQEFGNDMDVRISDIKKEIRSNFSDVIDEQIGSLKQAIGEIKKSIENDRISFEEKWASYEIKEEEVLLIYDEL